MCVCVFNVSLDVSVCAGSDVTSDAVDYIIGATRLTTDNNTLSNGFLVTFTSTAAGATDNTIVTLVEGGNNETDLTELTAGEDGTTDMVDGVDGTDDVPADDGIDTDRSGWIS